VDLVGQALPVAAVVSLALAPFWALALVWGSPQPTRVRFQIWLGLSVGFAMAWAVPMHGLMRALDGTGVEIWLAPVVGVASGVLGVRAIAVHRRRLAGEDVGAPRLAWLGLGLGAAVAVSLAPFAAGGLVGTYVGHAGPIALLTATQAWLLLPPNAVTRAGACAALFGVLGAAPLLAMLR
jgi:hypothetical protein